MSETNITVRTSHKMKDAYKKAATKMRRTITSLIEEHMEETIKKQKIKL